MNAFPRLRRLLLCLACLFLAGALGRPPAAHAAALRVQAVEVELLVREQAAVPGQTLMAALRLRHDPEWHTYWRNPGDSGLATTLDWDLPAGWKAGEILWPAPHRIFIGPMANYGFDGDLLLMVPLTVPMSATGPVRLKVHAGWLMCRKVCIPGEADLVLELPVSARATPSAAAPLFELAQGRLPQGESVAELALEEGRAALRFAVATARQAEFFPYGEQWLDAPAPQALSRGAGGGSEEGRFVLELRLAKGVDPQVLRGPAVLKEPLGLLVVDGVAREIRVTRMTGWPATGAPISVAAGSPPSDRPDLGAAAGRLTEAAAEPDTGVSEASTAGWLAALAFAFAGGLLLNFMPCVFPVIGLKMLSFAAGGDARRGADAFCAGVVLSFVGLAFVLLGLRAAGEAAGWGFQLQSPVFVGLMSYLFIAIALNLAGVFELGASLTRLGGVASGTGALSSFGTGVLAVLVATPCSAPFMGSAVGYTLNSSAAELIGVFACLGLGMASPYLVLGRFPGLLQRLPRPGRWMESLRQALAFPMLLTSGWLLWVLARQCGADVLLAWSAGAVLLALAGWVLGRFGQQGGTAATRRLGQGAALLCLVGALFVLSRGVADGQTGPVEGSATVRSGEGNAARSAAAWQAWSPAAVDEALRAGRPVFVDFTASWCISCQANKQLALDREAVVSAMQARQVLRLRADWTRQDPAITAELARHGRNGVPLYLLFVPGVRSPKILPELLTPGLVLDALGPLPLL